MSSFVTAPVNTTNPTLNGVTINGVLAGTADVEAVLAATATSNQTSAQDLTGFNFAIGANETWILEAWLYCTGASGVGIRFTVGTDTAALGGSGSIRTAIFGETSGSGTFSNDVVTALGTLSQTYLGGATVSGLVHVVCAIKTVGGTPGTIKLQYAAASATNVSVLLNSVFHARRVA